MDSYREITFDHRCFFLFFFFLCSVFSPFVPFVYSIVAQAIDFLLISLVRCPSFVDETDVYDFIQIEENFIMSNFGDSPDIGDSPERTGINSSNNHSSTSSIDSEETALSKYEHELERMMNESLVNGQDVYTQKLFIAFQNAAKAVTKMFRG
jgi:hypothetical protein